MDGASRSIDVRPVMNAILDGRPDTEVVASAYQLLDEEEVPFSVRKNLMLAIVQTADEILMELHDMRSVAAPGPALGATSRPERAAGRWKDRRAPTATPSEGVRRAPFFRPRSRAIREIPRLLPLSF